MAKTPRTWTGARTPSGLKRVRSAERRHAILAPRRSAAKTLVKAALTAATSPAATDDPQVALAEAISALDRAAKVGAIHPNAAARRKSRLVRKVNAAGGVAAGAGHATKTVGRAAAQKAAKARIAAGKADKAKGAQTAAGKARAALSKTSRAEAAASAAAAAKAPSRPAAKSTGTSAPKAATSAKPKAAATKVAATKATATKPAAEKKAAAKAPAKKAAKA